MRKFERHLAKVGGTKDKIEDCPFKTEDEIRKLPFKEAPTWHHFLTGRHLGIHRPDHRICNWTARIFTRDGRYVQRCVGPALDGRNRKISYEQAVERAFEWFATGKIQAIAKNARPLGRTIDVNFCPFGDVYTVGHSLKEYCDWSRISLSPGGHYNNLILINYHITANFSSIPMNEFNSRHLAELALQVIETPPRSGFMIHQPRTPVSQMHPDEVRRRKRTFNSLVTILKMAFRHSWENDRLTTLRPLKCLKRVPVNHSPRTIFLTREECQRLISHCNPALADLVRAGLYTGCRVGELAKIRVQDVGHQSYGVYVDAFKRGPARHVFLSDEGMAFFLRCCDGKNSSDFVLKSTKGLRWRKQHMPQFRRAVARAGLPRELVFHNLRHTYVSDLIRRGAPVDIIARQLGHADSSTIFKTYGHLTEQFREEQIRSKFTPLEPDWIDMVNERKEQLEEIWHAVQPGDWRDYAVVDRVHSLPRQISGHTDAKVLDVFEQVDGTYSE